MKVVEIFKSIDGEGIRAGYPVVFIRLAGCNLRCTYCDTKYSYNEEEYPEMTVEEIVEVVCGMDCKRVTLTGGEPLIHAGVDTLIQKLGSLGIEVNIETNGSVDIVPHIHDFTIITMDYKCPSSGSEDRMLLANLTQLRSKDVLKFVVGDEIDLNTCRKLINSTSAQVFISPVFGKIEPREIVEYMLKYKMNNCRIQLQLHKFIWDVNKRGV